MKIKEIRHVSPAELTSLLTRIPFFKELRLRDEKQLLPCAAYLTGQYGQKDIYVGVPCIIGRGGVEKIVEIDLPAESKAQFEKSVAAVRELCGGIDLNKKAA